MAESQNEFNLISLTNQILSDKYSQQQEQSEHIYYKLEYFNS